MTPGKKFPGVCARRSLLFAAVGAVQETLLKVAGTDLFDLGNFPQTFVQFGFECFHIGVFRVGFVKIPSGVLIAFACHQTVTLCPIAAVDVDLAELPADILKVHFTKLPESGGLAGTQTAAGTAVTLYFELFQEFVVLQRRIGDHRYETDI